METIRNNNMLQFRLQQLGLEETITVELGGDLSQTWTEMLIRRRAEALDCYVHSLVVNGHLVRYFFAKEAFSWN